GCTEQGGCPGSLLLGSPRGGGRCLLGRIQCRRYGAALRQPDALLRADGAGLAEPEVPPEEVRGVALPRGMQLTLRSIRSLLGGCGRTLLSLQSARSPTGRSLQDCDGLPAARRSGERPDPTARKVAGLCQRLAAELGLLLRRSRVGNLGEASCLFEGGLGGRRAAQARILLGRERLPCRRRRDLRHRRFDLLGPPGD